MSKDIEKQLAQAPKPRRELRADFTHDTLAKALAPKPRWWNLRSLRAAPVVAAVVIMLTAGSAYAAFNWQQVQVFFTGTSENKTFNTQEFGFDYKSCDALGGDHLRYGVAKSAHVTAEELGKLIAARCEVAQAEKLFKSQADWQAKTIYVSGIPQPVNDYQFMRSIETVESIGKDTISFKLAVQDPHGKPVNQFATDPLASNVRAYENGKQVSLDRIAPGDNVVQVQRFYEVREPGKQNAVIHNEVVGLVKVNAQPVNTALYDAVFEIKPCDGNPEATCVDAPSPALMGQQFHANEGEGGNFKVRKDITYTVDGAQGGKLYQAQGRVVAMDAGGFTMKAFESDMQFRVNIPEADRHAPYGQPTKLELGDAVAIRYLQKENENRKVINVPDIQASYVIVTSQNQKL